MRARKHLRKASDDDVTRRDGTNNRGEPPQDDHEFQRSSSSRDLGKDGYVQVKLDEIREKVQCPICLGIIRKTSAVMECLHRFCQECIAKHMLLRSNECPACHAHCGRNSLRADPRYDALIEAFYPDVSKSKELVFHEGKMTRKNQVRFFHLTRGDHEKTPLTAPTASDGISRSPAEAEDVFASHFPEVDIEEETPSQDEQQTARIQIDVPSLLDTPQIHFVEASAQTDPDANYQKIVELLLEIKAQQYAMRVKIQKLHTTLRSTSDFLTSELQSLNTQVSQIVTKAEVENVYQRLEKLKETMQSLEDFRLVRIPRQS